MNNDLKKVGLVFNANGTTDFIESLKNINSQLSTTRNQFKITQAQWDSSTSSTDKLKDKLDNLNKVYELQQQKVSVLRSQLEELKNAEEKDESAIRKKTNQLTQAEVQLQKYQVQIKETTSQLNSMKTKLEGVTSTLDDVGESFSKAGKKISVFSGLTAGGMVGMAKSAIDFESAFAGVEKTVDGTAEQMNNLKQGIRDMAKVMPASTTEISAVAEAAGQLGIATDDVLEFTKVMIDLGESTILSADEAATSLAKFANIMHTSSDDYSRLGSALVDLGNKFSTNEAEILSMSMRLAGASKTIGLTETDVLSLATALSSVGIEAEMGGSAISKAMIQMATAVETGNDQLEDFANIAGMSTEEFKRCFEEDAMGAISKFIMGLGDTDSAGKSTLAMLDDLGFSEVRLRDTMLRSANASELFTRAIEVGNDAWEDNTALTNEANKRYETLKSKLEITKNKLNDNAITIGNKLMPIVEKIVDKIGVWTEKISKLDDGQLEMILKIGAVVVASGPLITTLGKITSTTSTVIKGFGTFHDALKVAQGTMTSTSTAVNGLASFIGKISSPTGIAITAITTLVGTIGLIASKTKSVTADVDKDFKTMAEGAKEFVDGVNNATSQLNKFSDNLFISSEEKAELSKNMQTAQEGITEIVNLASQERRGYTDQEIQKLNEYFQTMHEISQRELEVQQQKSQTIVQMYTTELESYQGSLEGYQTLAQEKIKTMQDQRDVELQLIEESTVEQLALLNQRYGDQATMQNEAYAQEYNRIIAQKEANIEQANSEFASIYQVVTEGYAKRTEADDKYFSLLQETNKKIEEQNRIHADKIAEIENDETLFAVEKINKIEREKSKHQKEIQKIYNSMYKDLDNASTKELGKYLEMIGNTELYGGKLDEKTKEIVNGIVSTYNNMPGKTKEVMNQVMQPMLEGMQNSEPQLYAKATNIANGILGRLKTAFDIHSPSRKTREIFKNVMLGAEKGIESEEKNLYKQTNNVADNLLKEFENIGNAIDLEDTTSNPTYTPGYSTNNVTFEIDYNKLYLLFLRALNACKIQLDDDGFVRLIDNRLREVL